MMVALLALAIYSLGLVLTAVGSRLAGRCATWCCAVCGLPLWVVSGTVVSFCVVLPQLMLAFLAAGLDATALAVGCALAGAAASLGLVLACCFLRPGGLTADRGELLHKSFLLAAACLVLLVFVRDGTLSYTGTGLLMLLFVVFVLENIAAQYSQLHGEDLYPLSTGLAGPASPAAEEPGATVQFPAMSILNSLKNLLGAVSGVALLAGGALMLVSGAVVLANLTGTIQALWAATLVSLGFCLPLLAEAFYHPLGSLWQRFAERCRIYPAASFPMQLLNNAILSVTLVLPISSLMFRDRLPIGAQYRRYELPVCLAMALVLALPPLFKKRLYRAQGVVLLALYACYLAAVLLAPLAGA